ncbi:hypothetical protein C8F01DRAFT_292877 [Mycena amicta]|nr:hypothetical protein C8F01DRAFT_292877 [Mycena amicta]
MEVDKPPFLRLPPELLSEIFERIRWDTPRNFKFPAMSSRSSPLVLGGVCSYWRSVSLSTPTLWSCFQIFIQAGDSEESELSSAPHLELLRLWLKRSANVPIAFALNNVECKHPSPRVFTYLDEILLHCAHWGYADLFLPVPCLSRIRGPMPLLQHVSITPTRLPNDDEHIQVIDDAPRLTSVLIGECFMPGNMHLPWTGLTKLEARCIYEYELVHVLGLATNLVHCVASIMDSGEPSPPAALVAPSRLRYLRLAAHSESIESWLPSIFTPSLTLPALEVLIIDYPPNWIKRSEMDCLEEVIVRSGCVLKELRLPDSPLVRSDAAEGIPWLESVIFITSLALRSYLPRA